MQYSGIMSTVLEHLKKRHLDVDLHKPIIDEVEGVATFYLYNLSGQLVGYHQYRPAADKVKNNDPKLSRYFTYRSKGNNSLVVWGLETLYLTPKVLFVTEGLFDAARLTERGFSAIAVLSNDPTKDLKNWLFGLNRKIIAVCDSDENRAGRKLVKFGHDAVFTEDHDLGDSSDEFVSTLIKRFI